MLIHAFTCRFFQQWLCLLPQDLVTLYHTCQHEAAPLVRTYTPHLSYYPYIADAGSESESDAVVIELRQIAGYIEPCECFNTLCLISFSQLLV